MHKVLVTACPGKSVVWSTDRPAMTIAVDLGRKATKQTNSPCDMNSGERFRAHGPSCLLNWPYVRLLYQSRLRRKNLLVFKGFKSIAYLLKMHP